VDRNRFSIANKNLTVILMIELHASLLEVGL